MSIRHKFSCDVCGKTLTGHQRRFCSDECHTKEHIRCMRIREREYRKNVLHLLGDKCKRCGITDVRVLQIDHINGDGYKERIENNWSGRTVHSYYRHILDVKGEGYQLLCANCNWIKRDEQREYN